MKKLLIAAIALMMITAGGATAYASAFAGTTDYYFASGGDSEFYSRSEQQYNYEGGIPPELLALYDLAPAMVYTSEYGANIITPGGASGELRIENGELNEEFAEQIPSDTLNSALSTLNSEDYPDTWAGLVLTDNPSYDLTPVEVLRNSDGSIGRLTIPAIGLNVKVYDGDELAAMRKGVGHIDGTSVWDGNAGFVGHNRGTNNYFGKLKTLNVGDTVTYATNAGTRTYMVSYVGQIADNDWSLLQYTTDNRLTLITCVENVPNKRVVVTCVEVR